MSTQGKAQFTPGPWKAERDTARNAYAWKVTGAKGVVEDIARLALVDSVSQIEANATIIAAAPAMYEALQDIVEGLTDEITHMVEGSKPDTARLDYLANKAGLALAQAEGKS